MHNSPPWSEVHRPKSIDEVVGNALAISRLKTFVDMQEIPNLVVFGPSGVGKTCAITCMHRYWDSNPDNTQTSVLKMSGGDDRGVDSVRLKIKEFVCKKTSGVKLVILDEIDNITIQAQHALRGMMDKYPTARFAFCCNQIHQIIEQISSRCCMLKFEHLSDDDIIHRLEIVVRLEQIPFTPAGLRKISQNSKGDLRKALNTLQSLSVHGRITSRSYLQLYGETLEIMCQKILEKLSCNRGNSNKVDAETLKWSKDVVAQGFTMLEVCEALCWAIVQNRVNISEIVQVELFRTLYHSHSLPVFNDSQLRYLQFSALTCKLRSVVMRYDSR